MRQVDSSNIAGYEYTEEDSEARTGTLKVKFRNGRTYEYACVTESDVAALDSAADEGGSVGRVFIAQIRNAYEATEISD